MIVIRKQYVYVSTHEYQKFMNRNCPFLEYFFIPRNFLYRTIIRKIFKQKKKKQKLHRKLRLKRKIFVTSSNELHKMDQIKIKSN